MTKQELESIVNKNAKTNVTMHGEIDNNGQYAGTIEGSSTDELYAFVKYIAETRGEAFEQVAFRMGSKDPITYTCYIKFNSNDLNKKKGFFNKLFR